MTKYSFRLVSSLEKIFFDNITQINEYSKGSMLKNEIFSFQLACRVQDDSEQRIFCRLEIESELAPYIEIKKVGYVPVLLPTIEMDDDDDDYISKAPGLFPDPLYLIEDGIIELANNQTRAFWISVEPKGEITGTFPIILKVSDSGDEVLEELVFQLEIIDAALPEADIFNTCWLHGDCIAKLHHVEILSEAYWSLLEKYVQVYVKFGHNMILTPIVTPPLDTAVGKERPTNQLVGITVTDGNYSFDFTALKRFMDMCQRCGVKYFEMAHLFTQWGAQHAPKIMATVNGTYQRLFGWDTDATGEEYGSFLEAFLPRLMGFLDEEGVVQSCRFHISDEPGKEHEEQYSKARAILVKYIDETLLIDALQDYTFYEKGLVKNPVVFNDHIHAFMEKGVENLWTYYCMVQRKEVANRFMAMPSYRNRILGTQLYKYSIKGFLQWGFNFWFTQLSKEVLNPYVDTCAGGGFPAGDAFVVYPPKDGDGDVVCSLRLYVFMEGLQDMRAMKLLETLAGREEVLGLLEEINGFKKYPRNSNYLLALRGEINQRIKEKKKEVS